MAHKLIRSVLMKGLAGVVTEAVTAGRLSQIRIVDPRPNSRQLAGHGHAIIDRLLSGTRTHAERRARDARHG
jgi:hypothetical protein